MKNRNFKHMILLMSIIAHVSAINTDYHEDVDELTRQFIKQENEDTRNLFNKLVGNLTRQFQIQQEESRNQFVKKAENFTSQLHNQMKQQDKQSTSHFRTIAKNLTSHFDNMTEQHEKNLNYQFKIIRENMTQQFHSQQQESKILFNLLVENVTRRLENLNEQLQSQFNQRSTLTHSTSSDLARNMTKHIETVKNSTSFLHKSVDTLFIDSIPTGDHKYRFVTPQPNQSPLNMPNLVAATTYPDGDKLFVCRSNWKGDILIGAANWRAVCSFFVCYVPRADNTTLELKSVGFQLMTSESGASKWAQWYGNSSLATAGGVVGGRTSDGELLYVARCDGALPAYIRQSNPHDMRAAYEADSSSLCRYQKEILVSY